MRGAGLFIHSLGLLDSLLKDLLARGTLLDLFLCHFEAASRRPLDTSRCGEGAPELVLICLRGRNLGLLLGFLACLFFLLLGLELL